MPYKLVFGQAPRGALIPNGAKHVQEEPTVYSPRQQLQASPQTWVIQQEKLLTWTSSPSPPCSPKPQSSPSQSGTPTPAELQLESPRPSHASSKQPESPRTPLQLNNN